MNCLWCGKTIKENIQLRELVTFKKVEPTVRCDSCSGKLVLLQNGPICRGCSRHWVEEGLCPDCQKWKADYPSYPFKHTALYQYNTFIKEWIEAYKYTGDYRLGELFKKEIQSFFLKQKKQIVPIPISDKSKQLRGFNQVEGLLDFAGVTYTAVLIHCGTGEKQSSKDRKMRMLSPQPFMVDKNLQGNIKGKHLILVDDIYTTGRTFFHAADCLRRNGAQSIETFSISR